MNSKNYISILVLCFIIIFSCKKTSLDIPAIGQVDESQVANKKGVEGLLIGAYSLLDGYADNLNPNSSSPSSGSNWIYGSICGSEAYEGSMQIDPVNTGFLTSIETFLPTARNDGLDVKWAAVYAGVQRANEVLRVMKKATDISPQDGLRITAEARFLRGFYHFEAIKVFKNVPYVDETVTYHAANYYLSNDTLIWPAIENDLSFAMNNLPEIMNAVGRANKYTAEAYLAKTYLFQFQNKDKLAKAKPLLEELISSGKTALGVKYNLTDRFGDNFNPETKNSSEAVFSAQMSVNDASRGTNGNSGDILNYPMQGPGLCCGFFQPSQYLVNHFKTDAVKGLPDLDHFNEVDVKNDSGLLSTDPFTPDTRTLDPRLDWTVGRRGIPYRDWGVYTGHDWVRDQAWGGPYSPIKNTFSKSQLGHYTDNNGWSTGFNASNINLLRFADILLWAAEIEVEIGDLNKAREYVNRVRARAANPNGRVKNTDGTNAANYFILQYTEPWTNQADARKAVRFERMLELGMEGHRFFDLVRWGVAEQEIKAYIAKEKTLRTYLNAATFKKDKNECFPIPQTQIDLSVGPDGVGKLKQNPGY